MDTATEQRVQAMGDAMRDKYFMQKVQRMVDVFNAWHPSTHTLTAEELLEAVPGLRSELKRWSDIPTVYFGVFNINDYTPQRIIWVTQSLLKCNCN